MAIVSDLLQLCRLCLVKDEVNVPIFEGESDDQQISLKISSCLPVTLSQDDRLPQKICSECCRKLDTLYEFRNSSVNAEKQLVTWLEELENQSKKTSEKMSIATESLSEKTIVKEEIDEVDENGALSNEAEDYILQQQVAYDKTDLLNDAADETGEPQPKRAKRAAALKALIHTQESEEDEEDIDEPEPITKAEEESEPSETDINESVDDTFAGGPSTSADDQPGPSGVGKSTEGPNHLHLPRNLVYGPSISITPINKYVKSRSIGTYDEIDTNGEISENSVDPALLEPVTSIKLQRPESKSRLQRAKKPKVLSEVDTEEEDETKAVHCEICDVTYKNNITFAFHSIMHNNENKYTCHFCDYRNSSKYHIEMHIRAHEGTTKYKCEICNKAFTVSTHAIEHKYFHTGEKPFKCEICGKHFMFSWFLTSHRRSQHWEIMTGMPLVKYDCPICKKHYTSATGLKRHKISKHNTDGLDLSVLCDICGKRLSSKEKLKFHRRTHTGYKPYACEVCTKSFSRKEQLKEHERVHTGEKPFICKYCGKGFSQRSPLRIHERTHTGERPYVCRLCGRGFISKGVMDTHMKNCSAITTLDPIFQNV